MKLDHAEFISRHHKSDQPARIAYMPPKLNVWALVFVAISYIAFCLVIADALNVEHHVLVVLVILFTGAFVGAYALQQIMRLFSPEEKERVLLKEILEASRGARMITDGANNAVITNSRFDDLVKGIGAHGYDTLVKLFASNEEALNHFRGLADQAHRGLTDTLELKLDRGDHYVWIMVTAQPVPGWAGYIHWRLDDITEQYERNRIVSEEREKLIDFTDNAPVGFFSVDEQGRFVFVNATLARWLGEDIEVLLNNGRLHSYIVDVPSSAAPYDIKDGGGVRQVAEIRMKGPGGKVFLASINQSVVHEADGRVRTRGVVNDLTAERAMRQALEESEVRFRRFFEEAPVGIVILDKQLVVDDCNDFIEKQLNLPADQIEGHSFKDMVDKDDWDNVQGILARIKTQNVSADPVEVRLWAQGREAIIPARMYARKFEDSDHILLHFIDLTQQKSLESQFIQSQKMQAVGQLAGGIAHDFNNLLTAIIGFCDLLLLRHKPGDPSFGDLQQIKQNSNRAANLVRQLLAFSRQQVLRSKVQDVTDIMTELAHLLRRLIGANIELKFTHGDDLGYVKVDGGQMEQVLVNMAVNARDAMTEGGTLTVTTSHFVNRQPQKCGEDTMPVGHWVRIDVSDTGSGIPPEIIDRIFEPFFTTKDVGQGTGLGLATVYGIIRQSGGYLAVDSRMGEGTTFSIYLPRLTELGADDEKSAPPPEETISDLTGTARILLVEDEDAVRTFATRALTNKGYEVVTAESGEAGLQVFIDLKKPIDLLVTDVIMPDMDGPTLARHIREKMPTMKIIFMSGYTEDKLKDHMGEGVYFLPKPFTLKQLAAKVKEVMES
jgi:two-component system cell cycle sensor histidine kinase/response regulator CckA